MNDPEAAFVRRLVEAWNSKEVDGICAFFHDDLENWQMPLAPVRGLDAYRRHLRMWFDAYPDLQLEILNLFGQGDRVCLETVATGTPTGEFFGTQPLGGRQNRALDVLELDEGRVRRQRGYWDHSLWTGHPSLLATALNEGGQ